MATQAFAEDVGDGVTTTIIVEHDLGTKDVAVELYRNTSPWDTAQVITQRPSDDSIALVFTEPPELAAWRVVVMR